MREEMKRQKKETVPQLKTGSSFIPKGMIVRIKPIPYA